MKLIAHTRYSRNSLLPASIKTRILHLRATQFVGGPEKQILHHAAHASSDEHEIWIGSFRDGPGRPPLLERAKELGIHTLELSSGRFNPRAILQLIRAIRLLHISLLCTHGYKANMIGWAAARITGCPQIAYARGWTSENWRIKLYDRLDRFVLRRVEWVVCVSQAQASQLGTQREKDRAPIVLPNTAWLLPQNLTLPLDRLPVRRSLALPEDAFLVCAAGRLSVEKGQAYLLRATADLVRPIPNLHVLLLGEGAERQRLQRAAAQLGVQDRVRFVGFVDDVQPWIQACDVLVNPSLSEGVPNVILEAMALGTPVVATSVGGVPDLIEHQTSGLLVAPGDSTALAEAVVQVASDPTGASRLAQNAHKRLADYSPEKRTEQLINLYSKVLSSSKVRRTSGSVALPIES